MNTSLSKIYDLRITIMNSDTWEYRDLYFHFFDRPIADKWIRNFLELKSSDHSFRERIFNPGGSIESASNSLKFLIEKINLIYDKKIPVFQTFDRLSLNQLHLYYEEYGQRTDFTKENTLSSYFERFNNLIHILENKIQNENKLGIWSLISFNPRVDFELNDEDFLTSLPICNFGDLYLGYNTLGKNLSQAVNSKDKFVIENKLVTPQKYWSNEIALCMQHNGNPTNQLLLYNNKWKLLDVDQHHEYGNYKNNREGYIALGEMIPEQKDKFFSFTDGVDKTLNNFTDIHSVDIVFRRSYRDLDNIKRIPNWKYPVKIQGPEIHEIRNEGTVFITWLLNNICNYACRYCPEVLHNGKNVKHNWDIIEPFLNHLNSFYQGKNINFSFTGGEPTLSPFFPTMIKKIYDLDHRAGITTNLSRTQRYIEENFVYLNYASCSFHPAYEIKNNTANEYIEKLKLSSTITATNCRIMMDPDYWNQSVEFIEQIKELKSIGIHPVMIDSQYGYSSRIISEIKYTDEQLDWFSKFSYQKEYKKPDNEFYKVKENFSFAIFEDHEEKIIDPQTYINRGQTNFWNYQCMIGSESLFINHDGKIQRANCGVTGIAGTLDDWTNIDWERLKSPVSCPALMCHCGSDVLVSKKKVD
jgi:MoaA/NifB/PqqE/SkfB family radical SAM enzyme